MIRRWLLAAVMVASAVLPFLPAGRASAFSGRPAYTGYFQNTFDDEGSFVLSSGIYPSANPLYNGKPYTADFISRILGYANGATGRNKTGAEFIILTMLGYDPPSPLATRANALNPVTQAAWVKAVRYYSDQGWIRWGVTNSWTINTYWQGDNNGGPEPNDDAWYPEVGSFPDTIEFHQPGTPDYYIIKQNCANPIGDPSPLKVPPANFGVTLTATGVPLKVVPGQTYSINTNLHNSGPAVSTPGTLQVMMPGAGVCSPGVGCPLNQGFVPPAGITAKGFRAASAAPFPAGAKPNWYWSVKAMPVMPVGVDYRANMQWTVSPAAIVGTFITFDVYYAPGDLAGALRHVALTFQVIAQSTPAVVGLNGDIHAGGGLCGGALTSGSVKGYPGAGSGGQYVVSASAAGGINDFSSNGAGADTLKVGKTGSYALVCRPDLVKAALSYQAAFGWAGISGTVDVATLSPLFDVFFSTSPNLKLYGTVSRRITIVSTSGSVEIIAPIKLDGVTRARQNQASLGIIAGGNINIDPAATQVDAYLFSNSTIDTCYLPAGTCSSVLRVNGFLMASDIALHRLGPFNALNSPVAEQIVLNPQIYLNPPRLFDASVDDLLLEGQGESQPLF